MRIVVLDAYTANPGDLSWEELAKLGDLAIYDRTPPEKTIERAREADAILTNKVILDESVIASLPKLKYVGILATGANVVDLVAAKSRGIVVSNVPKYSTESVVQLVFAHILNLATRLADNASAVRNGEWVACSDFSFSRGNLTELYGKCLGIVGLGSIGSRVAQVGVVFGMNVVAYGPHLSVGNCYGEVEAVSLEKLFEISDIVTLHCPLNSATRRLVNKDRLEEAKDGMWLINTGRGQLLDEQDVACALKSGKLGGLGIDVLSTEPPKSNNPLLEAPNCYITPHNAWATIEARRRLIRIAVDNLKAFIANDPKNIVD